MINRFDNGGSAIQFNTPPLRGNGDTLRKRQRIGRDSNGDRYVSGKNPKRDESRALVFPRVPSALLAALLTFRLTTLNSFTWYDHAAVSRAVWFVGEIQYTQINPGAYRVTINLGGEV